MPGVPARATKPGFLCQLVWKAKHLLSQFHRLLHPSSSPPTSVPFTPFLSPLHCPPFPSSPLPSLQSPSSPYLPLICWKDLSLNGVGSHQSLFLCVLMDSRTFGARFIGWLRLGDSTFQMLKAALRIWKKLHLVGVYTFLDIIEADLLMLYQWYLYMCSWKVPFCSFHYLNFFGFGIWVVLIL